MNDKFPSSPGTNGSVSLTVNQASGRNQSISEVDSIMQLFFDPSLTHITSPSHLALRQKDFVIHGISATGLTVYQETTEMRRAMLDG